MSTFYTKFLELCSKAHISPTKAITEMGLSKSATTNWRRGSKPYDVTLSKIAEYFGVPVSYFDEKAPLSYDIDLQLFGAPLSDPEKKLLEIYRQLDPVEQAKLLVDAADRLNSK